MYDNMKIVRLLSGEELLCKRIEEDENGDVVLVDPVNIFTQNDENGKVSIGIVPFMPYTVPEKNGRLEELVPIKPHFIGFVSNPVDQLVDQYRRATSDIQVPNSGIAMP